MNPVNNPTEYWILGSLISVLIILIGAIYKTMLNAQNKLEEAHETNRIEVAASLQKANEGHEQLRKERVDALEKAKDDAADTHREMWTVIRDLEHKYNFINTQHQTWYQKHEDCMGNLKDDIERLNKKSNA